MQLRHALAIGLALSACAPESAGERTASTAHALAFSELRPLAQIYVGNAGAIDVEETYLPKVVCCENGAAPLEALRAQAVMARSYMFFRSVEDGLGTQAKPFTGTTADQAYFCANPVSQACRDAVVSTKGQITSHANAKGAVTANVSFYIDGPRPACLASKACACPKPATDTSMTPTDHPSDCACFDFASMGAANPAYVTYNWASSGANVRGSTIGSLANESNRGCASQNIQACLAYAGWGYVDQLRFFYGQDMQLRTIDGMLVGGGPDPVLEREGGVEVTGEPSVNDEGGCAVTRTPRRSSIAVLTVGALAFVLGWRRARRGNRRSSPRSSCEGARRSWPCPG
jgi:hypothetical protein